MNKIVVDKEKLKSVDINDDINVTLTPRKSLFDICLVSIDIKDNNDLYLYINSDTTKLKININVNANLLCKLYIITSGSDAKIGYSYNIGENSEICVIKYNRVDNIKEMVEINLNGNESKIDYLFKSISTKKESYDYAIFHNYKNTVSNIKNHGVNVSGNMSIQISSSIDKNITNCTCNQFNRIINLTNNKCEIRPILYIDTDNVDANHSALIGDFESEELFYLETMGISRKEAYKLLIKGFLLNKINDDFLSKKIKDSIKKYWR